MQVNRGGGGSSDARLSISLYGENTWVLMGLAEEVERRLDTIPGLLSVRTDMDRAGSELQVRLDRNQLERYGINPQTVSGSISYGIRGVDVNRYQSDDGREVIIRLQFEEGDRRSMQQLRTMTFPTSERRRSALGVAGFPQCRPHLGSGAAL